MTETIILSCLSCNAKLIISNSVIKRFICNSCGHEFIIIREGGITYLEDINLEHTEETNQIINHPNSLPLGCLEEVQEIKGSEKKLDVGQVLSIKRSIDFEKIRRELVEKKAIENIDAKIDRLQIALTNVVKNFRRFNIIFAVICLFYMAVVYALLPMFDSYKELFTTMGLYYAPMIVIFLGYYLVNRKTTISNQIFIGDRINSLQEERNNYINGTR